MTNLFSDKFNSETYTTEALAGFVADSLAFSLEKYILAMNKCIEGFSEESTHDIRVAIRRFSSLFKMIESISCNPVIPQVRQSLKKQIKIFGPLRDTQVQILKINELIKDFPVLSQFQSVLNDKEQQYLKDIQARLPELTTDDITNMTKILSDHLVVEIQDKPIPFREIFKVVDDAFTDLIEKISLAKKDDLKSIHKVRLAFKKFRYFMEHLKVVTGLSEEKMAEYKEFQTIMGEIQDYVVFVRIFEDFLSTLDPVTTADYSVFKKSLDESGDNLINKFFSFITGIKKLKEI